MNAIIKRTFQPQPAASYWQLGLVAALTCCWGKSPLHTTNDAAMVTDGSGGSGGSGALAVTGGSGGAKMGGAGGTSTGGSGGKRTGTGGSGGGFTLNPVNLDAGGRKDAAWTQPDGWCDQSVFWQILANAVDIWYGTCMGTNQLDASGVHYVSLDGDGRIVDIYYLSFENNKNKQAWLDGIANMHWPCLADLTIPYTCINYI